MPTYNYYCEGCNQHFESFRKIDNRKAPESEACPSCGVTGKVRQGITSLNFALSVGVSKDTRQSLKGSKFEEKLNEIHQKTAGSQLDKQSTIVDVKG